VEYQKKIKKKYIEKPIYKKKWVTKNASQKTRLGGTQDEDIVQPLGNVNGLTRFERKAYRGGTLRF